MELPSREDIETPYDRKAGYAAVEKILAQGKPPSAIACCSDTVAFGVMHGLRQRGFEPGKDIAVTGYDDIEEASIAGPALTTVNDGHDEIGRLAAKALYSKIKGEHPEAKDVLIEPTLKIRDSVNRVG